MAGEETTRGALEELYESLSPTERRERFVLSPAFRDAYNEIVGAHRQFPVPRYLWDNWLPLLGPLPVTLYLQLRQYCFYDPKTGERRDICWPRQRTLARQLGVKQRQTVARALALLEQHGFIERRKKYLPLSGGKRRRVADEYRVWFEVPLIPSDGAELLHRQTSPKSTDYCRADDRRFEKRTYGLGASPGAPRRFENRTHQAVRNSNSRDVTGIVTRTLNANVEDGVLEEPGSDDASRQEALVHEIGEQLDRMEGGREGPRHKSERFHRILVSRLPETLIRQALMATRDAVDDQRAGRKTLRSGPSAYFAGIAFSLAEENRIDLGVNRRSDVRSGSAGPENRGAKDPLVPGASEADTMPRNSQVAAALEPAELSDEERNRARQLLHEAIRRWESHGGPAVTTSSPTALFVKGRT
jgi:hypothetical protein